MFQSLVITLREGVEAALIIGIVLSYLGKIGRASWDRIVYWGLAAAIAASIVAAHFVRRMEVAEEAYEGWLLLIGAAFVASMVIWMWRTGRRLKQQIETKLLTLSGASTRAGALGLFLFVFLLVFREGLETVLFLTAVSLRTSELANFMGGILGLGLALGLGVAFFKGSLRVNLRQFFSVTSLVLMVVAVQLAVAGVHELSEARILPSSRREMALIGPIVNNDAFFFVVVVGLAVFLILAHRIQAAGPTVPDGGPLAAAERRKGRAELARDRFWKVAASAVGLLIIVLISSQLIYSRVAQAVSPPERVTLANGEVRIPLAQLTDRKLHRYVVSTAGAEVRLIAVLDASDTVRAALDACLICGNQGYYQDGGNVICRNCAAAIYVPTIGSAGGCNPIHIDYLVEGDRLVFSEKVLAASSKHFQ